ncbi:MAG: mechanosensitive ion channel family protein, partial [Candidatus Latescibacteria bacterium]|nr:mechanosensitive ion channel family protein [Candidatus Latescibacterota bacterium]
LGIFHTLFSEQSPYRGVTLSFLTIAVMWILYKFSTRAILRYTTDRAFKAEGVHLFLRTWRYTWIATIGILAVISLSGSLSAIGLSAGFFGMMLGWSLQAPVTGIAAWLMIILKRPFKIGERVIIAGIVGDVTNITLTHVILDQVGGTIGSEDRSGRGVLIPNAILFQSVIYNYTLESKYILDEVPVRITFNSDWDETERILLDAARQVTAETIAETGQEPFTRAEFFEAGILVRLRYQATPSERPRVSNLIVKILFNEINKSDRVHFCYPHTKVLYEWVDGEKPPPQYPAYRENQGIR